MSAIPTFNQVNPYIYALSTLTDTGLDDYWVGYAAPSEDLGTSAGTAVVWQNIGGFYLFLDNLPADWDQFTAQLSALRPNLGPPDIVRFVWIANVGTNVTQWQITTAYASATGTSANINWVLMRSVAFNLDAYRFSLSGASMLTYIADMDGGGIGFTAGGGFSGPEGSYTFPFAQIPFSGPALGAFSSQLAIPAPTTLNQGDLWNTLHIGLQYAAAPPSSPPDDGDEAAIAYAQSTQILFMPVFSSQSSELNLGLTFDPLFPLIASRTALSLFPPAGNDGLILNTYIRTTKGYAIQLTPLAANGALPDARFIFGFCPVEGDRPESGTRYHLCPDGSFAITVQPPEGTNAPAIGSSQIMLGLSGLEYVNLDTGQYMITFEGSKPAFIPVVSDNLTIAPSVAEALTNLATTAHLNVLAQTIETADPVYYAQPIEAPVFSGRAHRTDNVLDFNPMPAFTLTYTSPQRPPVFPVGIYAGLTSNETDLAREMENASLAPYRNYSIGQAYGTNPVTTALKNEQYYPKRRVRAVDDPLGITPQGLIAELTPDYSDFDGLIIGNMPGTDYPTIDLTVVEGLFKQSLQSNQLFFVAANVDVLMTGTSVRYELTEAEKPFLLAMGVPQEVIDAVYADVSTESQPFDTEGEFVACIGADAGTYLPDFLKVAGILKAEMDDWTFQLSPRAWRTDPASPTLMITKFCNRSLLDLANDSSSWAWPEVATPKNGTLARTQRILLSILNASGVSDATAALKIFYNTVVINPNWNGFLFLNAPVDIAEMPNDLKFLTAGIDLTQFYAHHVGFSQTPFSVQNGAPQLEQTAAFGLIDYEDAQDLYSDQTIPLGFKTMTLSARFANAALADFSAEVELMLNQLLGSLLTKRDPARGNNLIIQGSYQRVGGAPSYAFTLAGENYFNANKAALTSIEVLSVQLVNGGDTSGTEVLTTFVLTGNLRFFLIETFDLFSFGPEVDNTIDGYLRYTGFSIDMLFSLATPTEQTFITHEANMGFDSALSHERTSSLIHKFPLTVSGLIASPNLSAPGETPTGQSPENMGYTSISAPLDQTPMVPSWYGLVFTLDLGTFGALTGSVSFKISILAAWSRGTGQGNSPVYLGLKLPGISAIAGSFPLQGVLKLGFRSFQFETYTDDAGQLGYLLRLRRFALSVFVWSFPPGNSDIILFGDPDNPRGSLGWYAAYSDGSSTSAQAKLPAESTTDIVNAPKQQSTTDRVQRRLRSGRRTPPIG
jgi:hypothetical protein